jgi:diguanylate cyclase (GGDEF)-like protein
MALGLVHELTAELALATSGVGFIASCLDRLVERLDLADATAVLHDPVLGPQIFTAGRRPLPFDATPSAVLGRGPGVHTEPTVLDHTADLEAIRHLCEIALRLDRLQYESLHDPLTGLYNRRGFDAQLVHAVSRAQRYRWTFALVLLDLDGFKTINDRLGHQRGDAVLRAVGERLRLGLRAGDVAARVGGDEFALIVHVGAEQELLPVLDRLGDRSILGDDEADDVAWTVGMAVCPNDGATADELYRIADNRLYEAKSLREDASGGQR